MARHDLVILACALAVAWCTASDCAWAQKRNAQALRVSFDPPESTPSLVDPADGEPMRKGEMVSQRYPDGSVKSQRWVVLDEQGNYVNHGLYKAFDQQGHLVGSGHYDYGIQSGVWTRYFLRGQSNILTDHVDGKFKEPFISRVTLKDGKIDQGWTITDKDGRRILHWQFENGRRHGLSTWWYASGRKQAEVHFINGKMDGEFIVWTPAGKETVRGVYVEGRKVTPHVEHHAPGKKMAEGHYLEGPDFDAVSYDWWNGNVETVPATTRTGRQKHGVWRYWYANGRLKMTGEYREDLPVGKFTWWYENGQKQAEGRFADGQQAGVWVGWHLNGMKKYHGEYDYGTPTGLWMAWHQDGLKAEQRQYADGDAPLNEKEPEQITKRRSAPGLIKASVNMYRR